MRHIILTGSILLGALLCGTPGLAQNKEKGGVAAAGSYDSIHGPSVFTSYCASCHGTDGKGGGPVVKALKAPPPDLTRISVRNGGTFPDARVSKIISGDDLTFGAHGSREMPVWGPVFSLVGSDRELGRTRIENLVRYLREMQKP